MSSRASNVLPSDTRSDIAPQLPAPPVAVDAGPRAFLRAAQTALNAGHTGEAQEALERAETRALDRSAAADQADQPDAAPMIHRIGEARDALGRGDIASAKQTLADALATPGGADGMNQSAMSGGSMGGGSMSQSGEGASGGMTTQAAMPPMTGRPAVSSSGETALGGGVVPETVGDDARTYNKPGDNGFTERERGVPANHDEDLGPTNGQN